MLSYKYVYEQHFELYRTGFLWNGNGPRRIALSQFQPSFESVSRSDNGPGQRRAASARHATHVGRERRSEPRFGTNRPALLQILNPFSDECWHVRVLDVSKNGLGLYMSVAPMPGSAIKVRMKDCVAFGSTRYSVRTTGGFLVGVQVSDHILSGTTSGTIRAEVVPGEWEIS